MVHNPFRIGWFARRQLKYMCIISIILTLIYYFFIKKQVNVDSIGCIRNGCRASPCIGSECTGDNCIGIGCHAGNCYGEECNAGTCEGFGCIGGNCYGAKCTVGKCKDPACPSDKESKGLCKPNCKWGRAYNINSSSFSMSAPIQNTYFNKNNCINPNHITENLIKDDKIIYNFSIKGANYYNGEFLSYDEIKAKIAKGNVIDEIKGLIRYNDPIINTIPNIYKNNNCNWSTVINNVSIDAKYAPTYNYTLVNQVDNHNYTWASFKTTIPFFDKNGNETMCLGIGPHIVSNLTFSLDVDQIKTANVSTIIPPSFLIENIHGTIMSGTCDTCNLNGVRTLTHDNFPKTIFGTIALCKERAYIYKDENNIEYKISINDTFDDNELQMMIDTKHFIRNHHLMIYNRSDILKNTMTYICFFCNKESVIYYDKIFADKNTLTLISCTREDDYDHYIIDWYDNELDKVIHKCIKCDKTMK